MDSQFDLNNFNSFIQAASQQIACGTECQKQKTAEQLKNTYLNAQSNLTLAQPQYDTAKKNYYLYLDGQNGYNKMMEEEYSTQSNKKATEFKHNYNKQINKIKSLLGTYRGILINFRNIVDLYTQYKEENLHLFKSLKTRTNDVLTNERKTYYEDQKIDGLKGYYYYILLGIYIIFLIGFIIFSIMYPSQTNWKIKLASFIGFILLPFFSTWILGTFIYLIYKLYDMLPKNVYAEKTY